MFMTKSQVYDFRNENDNVFDAEEEEQSFALRESGYEIECFLSIKMLVKKSIKQDILKKDENTGGSIIVEFFEELKELLPDEAGK
ncbi:hypothetical protein Tco_0377292 [Tanacetum coccineum]